MEQYVKIELQDLNRTILEQSLKAAEILLPKYDLNRNVKALFPGQARLGFPAAILIFSFIEAVGHIVLNKDCEAAYEVLNNKDLFNLGQLDFDQYKGLYDNYRCALIHNMTLPPGYRLDFQPNRNTAFDFDSKTNAIIKVNLSLLFKRCKYVLSRLTEDQSDITPTHRMIHTYFRPYYKGIAPNMKLLTTSPSGYFYSGYSDLSVKKIIGGLQKNKKK